MKQPASRLFFLLVAFVLVLHGCKPDKEVEPNVTDEDYKAIKDYTYFKPGTYWIYEDSHGNTDSMFVYDAGVMYPIV